MSMTNNEKFYFWCGCAVGTFITGMIALGFITKAI